MPETFSVTAYEYYELSEKAQRKALAGLEERYGTWAWDQLQNELEDDLSEWYGWTEAGSWLHPKPGGTLGYLEAHYDFGFCQGSGFGVFGLMDALDIKHERWIKEILPLMGAHKTNAVVAGQEVTWPSPVLQMDVEIVEPHSGPGGTYYFSDRFLQLRCYVRGDDQTFDGEEIDTEIILTDEDNDELFQAVANYFQTETKHIYDTWSNAILEATSNADLVAGFFECYDEMRFDEDGNEIDPDLLR